MPIKYWINYDSFKAPNCTADFTSTEIYYLVLNSFITWEQYTGARFAVKYMGNSSLSKTEWAGDENEILFVCEEAGGGALGSYYKTGSDWCGNAVIVYDDDVDFAPQFSGGWGDNASTILIHEIGHLLGFHHTLDPCAIMFPDVANIYPEWGEVSALRNAYGAKSQNIDIYSRSYNTTAWNYYLPLSDTLQAPAIEHDPSSNICIAWQDATVGAFTPIRTTTYPPLDSSDAGTYTYHSIGLAYSSEYDYYLMLHVGHHNWDQDRQVYYQTSRDCENWSTWYEVPTDSGGWPTTSSSRPGVAYNSHEDAFYVILPYYYPFCGQLEASSGMGLLRFYRYKRYSFGIYYWWEWDVRNIGVSIDHNEQSIGDISLICASELGQNCILTWQDAETMRLKSAEIELVRVYNDPEREWKIEFQNIQSEGHYNTYGVGEGVYFPEDYQGKNIHIGLRSIYLYNPSYRYLYDWSKGSQVQKYLWPSLVDMESWTTAGEGYSPYYMEIYKAFTSGSLDVQ